MGLNNRVSIKCPNCLEKFTVPHQLGKSVLHDVECDCGHEFRFEMSTEIKINWDVPPPAQPFKSVKTTKPKTIRK